jgi:hypothetical protein
MSTFGREADRLAEQRRRHERRVTAAAIALRDAVAFSIATLKDKRITDALARSAALDALKIGVLHDNKWTR